MATSIVYKPQIKVFNYSIAKEFYPCITPADHPPVATHEKAAHIVMDLRKTITDHVGSMDDDVCRVVNVLQCTSTQNPGKGTPLISLSPWTVECRITPKRGPPRPSKIEMPHPRSER